MNRMQLVPVWAAGVSRCAGEAQISFVALDVTERHWRYFVPAAVFPSTKPGPGPLFSQVR